MVIIAMHWWKLCSENSCKELLVQGIIEADSVRILNRVAGQCSLSHQQGPFYGSNWSCWEGCKEPIAFICHQVQYKNHRGQGTCRGIALLSSSIGIGLVSSSARVAPIKSQHRTVITHVSEWQKCRPLDGTPSIPEGFEKSRTQSRICLRTLNLERLFFHQALKQKQDSIALLWLTISFSPAWTYN